MRSMLRQPAAIIMKRNALLVSRRSRSTRPDPLSSAYSERGKCLNGDSTSPPGPSACSASKCLSSRVCVAPCSAARPSTTVSCALAGIDTPLWMLNEGKCVNFSPPTPQLMSSIMNQPSPLMLLR